jgi:hypothetical protein
MDCHDRANGGEATCRWLAVFPPPVSVAVFLFSVPELTRSAGIQLNKRVWLQVVVSFARTIK